MIYSFCFGRNIVFRFFLVGLVHKMFNFLLGIMDTYTGLDMNIDTEIEYGICEKIRTRAQQEHGKNIKISIYFSMSI